MDRKGAATEIIKQLFGLLIAALIILALFHIFNYFAGLASQREHEGTKKAFKDMMVKINGLGDRPDQHNLFIGEELVLYGFDSNSNYVEYDNPGAAMPWDYKRKVERPLECGLGFSCLCVCNEDCKKIRDCEKIGRINKIVAKSKFGVFNMGFKRENEKGYFVAFFGKTGLPIVKDKWNVRYIKFWKEGDTLYFDEP